MKKRFLWVIVIVCITIGIIIGWKDNGPQQIDSSRLPSRFDE